MNNWLNLLLFQILPYVSVTVLLVGSWLRFDRDQYSWRSGSSEMLRKRQLVIGSNLFHLAVIPLLAGHVVGMLTPVSVMSAMGISVQAHAMIELVMGGLAGIVCFIGALILLHRRLFDRRILRTSSWSDLFILILIVVQLGMGVATLPASWEDQATGATLVQAGAWAQGLVTFQPDAWTHAVGIPAVYKAHIVMGLVLFLIAPFTRLVHIWSAPIWYLGRAYQVVRVPFRKGSRRKQDEWQSV